jgi:hypothetical protein
MNPSFGRRTWVKLWTKEWLEGTTRYQMSGAQRAFWIDLLALAGRSRYPGIICAGRDGERFIGYPLKVFCALDAGGEIDIEKTFELFEQTEKIRIEVTAENPVRLYKLTIVNWDHYQSEAHRKASQRERKHRSSGNVPSTVPAMSHQLSQECPTTDTDTDTEVDKNHCANLTATHDGNSPVSKRSEGELNTIRRVWDYYLQKLGKNSKILSFTALRKNKGVSRLRECLLKTGGDMGRAEGLMRVAVDALAASAFHVGENEQKKRYDSWEKHLFKSQEQLEQWLERS